MGTGEGRILVVDDHATDRLKLSMAVKRLGYEVDTAAEGREALEKLKESSFNLVLLDLLMPEMDGFEVLEAMRSDPLLQTIPVIIVSSLNDNESLDRATSLGATGHLAKSFEPSQLESCLSRGLGGESTGASG